jgi:hypothetical protein
MNDHASAGRSCRRGGLLHTRLRAHYAGSAGARPGATRPMSVYVFMKTPD